MSTGIVLFTRDLRIHDNPALAAGLRHFDRVLPVFVFEPRLLGRSPNRLAFLLDSLRDLDAALGGRLVTRSGDTTEEVARLAAEVDARGVELMADASSHARRREAGLRRAGLQVRAHPGVAVLAPGAVTPGGGDHFAVFTPYYRRWRAAAWRRMEPAPRGASLVGGVASSPSPEWPAAISPRLPSGGESAARRRLQDWLAGGLTAYADRGDDLGADATSRLSPDLHFGCLSALEVAVSALEVGGLGAEAFVRQLCWRDFHLQVLAARPDLGRADYRPRADRWRTDADDLERWKAGRTGFPIVDAAMRQLQTEGWIANRARLVAASFLVKDLYLDWRLGLDHFDHWLVDGDLASNAGNWQWTAGTGNDSRPNRVLNPERQQLRFDPQSVYARRHIPEWGTADYPAPMLDHSAAAHRFLAARRGA